MNTFHVTWRKSSWSADEGNCVEIGTWRRANARASHVSFQAGVLARDSKDPDGPVLGFGAGAWGAFLDTVKSGRLDLS